jgi:hypothetical protein
MRAYYFCEVFYKSSLFHDKVGPQLLEMNRRMIRMMINMNNLILWMNFLY